MAYPASPTPSSLTLTSTQPTLVSTTHSLKQQVRSRGGQRWGLRLDYNNLTRAEFAPFMAFALAQRGQYGTFDVVPAVLGRAQSAIGGSAVTSGSHAAGVRSVATSGWTGSLKAGDLVKFANHAKVYMLTADCAAAGALAIEPALHAAVPNGTALTTHDVPMRMRFASDEASIPLRPGVHADLSVELVEAL